LASLVVAAKLTLGLGEGLGLGLGLAGVGLASALLVLPEFPFAGLASELPAITGTAMTATTKKLDNHFFSVDIKTVSPSGRALYQNDETQYLMFLNGALHARSRVRRYSHLSRFS
jgi:hypothetical protein